ncbi:DUF1254 domain-containing protein [uncultured Umboniibacter sp.]|uniref:DUF1254 domain-containing protein n=1 Tax=uncultured Umboniibacter sp. TaxID=1798917 RepID=UPI0026359084|nr:DUF1254 domain-containing protein [uncultured Umboniibacter sp.]
MRLKLMTLILISILASCSGDTWKLITADKSKLRAAGEGYVYGLPLVIMDGTRIAMTDPRNAGSVPINTFRHQKTFPDANFTAVVRPAVDFLYSTAMLDLSAGPIELNLPSFSDRYYMMPILDAYTNVIATPSSRNPNEFKQRLILVGPDHSAPEGDEASIIRSPTNLAWAIGRIAATAGDDQLLAAETQSQISLIAENDLVDIPSVQRITKPKDWVSNMSAEEFFYRLSVSMAANPPATNDDEIIGKLEAINFVPGEPYILSEQSEEIQEVVALGVKVARERLQEHITDLVDSTDADWRFPPDNLGRYGVDYNTRALVALVGLGANLQEDAVYPSASRDSEGRLLDGAHSYRLHFPEGTLPPARALWSITVYGSDGFLQSTATSKYKLGSMDSLVLNADGSVDLFFGGNPPEGRESNWLPANPGEMVLTMRLYWPEQAVLNGSWNIPRLERLN